MKSFLQFSSAIVSICFSISEFSETKLCVDKRTWAQENYYFNGVRWDASKPKSDKSNFNGPPSDSFSGKVTYQQDGKVIEAWNIKVGKATSYEKYEQPKNTLVERWTYKDGCAHGDIRTDVGSSWLTARYENGFERGLQKQYDKQTNKLVEEWTVGSDGQRGVSLKYDKFSNLESLDCDSPVAAAPKHKELCGLNGKQSSVKLYSIENDKSIVRRELGYLNGKKHGMEKVYDEEGKVISSVNYKNGNKDGVAKSAGVSYNNSGASTVPYVNGKAEGKETRYFQDSKNIKEEILWKNDEVVRHIEFYQNGKSKVLREFKGGKIHVTTFNDNGKRESFATVRPSSNWWGSYYLPDGKVIYYQDDGEKLYEANFKFGERDGTTSYFFSGGKKVSEKQVWKDGKMTSETEYGKDGKIIKITEFFPDGSKKVKTP